jgi:hypothetical protein
LKATLVEQKRNRRAKKSSAVGGTVRRTEWSAETVSRHGGNLTQRLQELAMETGNEGVQRLSQRADDLHIYLTSTDFSDAQGAGT